MQVEESTIPNEEDQEASQDKSPNEGQINVDEDQV